MKNYKYLIFYFFISGLILFNACNTGINFFSQSDDVKLGREVSGEIAKNPKEYPIFKGSPSIKKYITNRIFKDILASPQIASRNTYKYQLKIIDNPKVFNAFALPGGYIYVYTGLLKYLDSEAALAGVLGHEIAHAERRHGTKRMTASYGVGFLLNLVLGRNPSQISQIASNLFVGLAFLANSRSDENEADEFSFNFLKDTRYYPGGVKFFFEHMKADNLIKNNPGEIEKFLSTHPDPIDRIANTDERLKASGLPILHYTSKGKGIYRNMYFKNVKNKLIKYYKRKKK